jgi:hypothetical protein
MEEQGPPSLPPLERQGEEEGTNFFAGEDGGRRSHHRLSPKEREEEEGSRYSCVTGDLQILLLDLCAPVLSLFKKFKNY